MTGAISFPISVVEEADGSVPDEEREQGASDLWTISAGKHV